MNSPQRKIDFAVLFSCFYCRKFKKIDKWEHLTKEEVMAIKSGLYKIEHKTCPACKELGLGT